MGRFDEDDKTRKKKQFLIDTYGKVYRFRGDCSDVISIHYQIAHSLYPDLVYPADPVDHVMKLGWVLCGSSVYNCPIIHGTPTQAQLDRLFDLKILDRLSVLHKDGYVKYSTLVF